MGQATYSFASATQSKSRASGIIDDGTMLTVIIGNGAVTTDLKEAYCADRVVRINRCDNIGGNTGTRTDILALTTTGTPPIEFFNAPTELLHSRVSRGAHRYPARYLVLSSPPANISRKSGAF